MPSSVISLLSRIWNRQCVNQQVYRILILCPSPHQTFNLILTTRPWSFLKVNITLITARFSSFHKTSTSSLSFMLLVLLSDLDWVVYKIQLQNSNFQIFPITAFVSYLVIKITCLTNLIFQLPTMLSLTLHRCIPIQTIL